MRLSIIMLSVAMLAPVGYAAAQSTPETEQVIQRERDIWQYVKEKNITAFRAALDSSYTGLSHYGAFGMSLEAARYEWTSLDRYQLTDFVARRLDTNTILLTYKAQLKGKSLGLDVEGSYWMATVWMIRSGGMKAVFHAHVAE